MARLIVKSPYIKGGGKGGYAKYIATRDGVELLPSGYMEYMAERPRSHGLFGDHDNVDLPSAIQEVNQYPGNIWTHIISLKREDADRLGYDHAAAWRNLIRAHRNDIAKAMHIPPQNFRWYAAFHDESDHPHVHMMAWSAKPGQAYLSKEGIRRIKSVLTNDIFRQEMLHTYDQKSIARDKLVRESRQAVQELIQSMRDGVCDHPGAEQLMLELAEQLGTVTGKKSYGYLPKRLKNLVDEIVGEMDRLPVVSKCYDQWLMLQGKVDSYYQDKPRERIPLSRQKEFRQIKNAVIREAERICSGEITFEDMQMDDEPFDEEEVLVRQTQWQMMDAYREAKYILCNDDSAWAEQEGTVHTLEWLWDSGLTVAAHQLGKCWRDGLGVLPDDEKAELWFRRSAEAGNDFSQYSLGKLLQGQKRITEAVEWYKKAAAQGNHYASYRLGKLYLQGKNVPKDEAKAVRYLTASSEAGNQYAQYALGKLYLEEHDKEQAHYWFTQSAAQGNEYAQFFVYRWDSLKPPSVMLSVTRLLHRMGQTFRDNSVPLQTPVGQKTDRKLQIKLREKKMALGHKADDHEEQSQDWTMTMG